MRYTKMHGAGNSFLLIEDLGGELRGEDLGVLALRLCSAQSGPGADGMIVVRRAEGADLGMLFYIQKILRELDRLRTHMMQVFTVDDLMYLKRGGRISRMKAVIASVLNIKPILRGDEEGRIVVTDKTVGRKASIRALADDLIENIDEADACGVGIAQAGCTADTESLIKRIRAKFPNIPILTVPYEPVTGSHVGPGALALFYISRQVRAV